MNNEDDRTSETQALKADLLGISAATCEGEQFVLLTLRLNRFSFQVTDVLIPLHQAQERLQVDLADLLERSPVFKEES